MSWFDKPFRRPPAGEAPAPEPARLDRAALRRALHDSEGRRRLPYRDTVGKLSIGVGRNLDDVGLRDDEIDLMLDNDIDRSIDDLDRALPWWRTLDSVRQLVIVEMCFNLGIGSAETGRGLLGFSRTLESMRTGAYDAASEGMLRSKWASQVGRRAIRLATMMRTGVMP